MKNSWARKAAGYYIATINGHSVEVESFERSQEWGGRGWVLYIDNKSLHNECRTLAEAKTTIATIASQRSDARDTTNPVSGDS